MWLRYTSKIFVQKYTNIVLNFAFIFTIYQQMWNKLHYRNFKKIKLILLGRNNNKLSIFCRSPYKEVNYLSILIFTKP